MQDKRVGAKGEAFEAVVEVMNRLRAPDGCPWDKQQTLKTLKTYVIEEAYEVIEAIDSGRPEALREELGDLLLQIVFQAKIMEEQGAFDIADVCNALVTKLVSRHPHVFGQESKAENAAEVLNRWEGFKRKEGRGLLDGVPGSLPALLMALRISDKARNVGFDWPDNQGAVDKLDEEIAELKEAIAEGDEEGIEDEIGDVLFSIANISRNYGLNPEEALRRMLVRFKKRFSHIEKTLASQGKSLGDQPLKALDDLWNQAKELEK
ncbi:MAG TPA: nucleoside triphosphate pyrophosphohydrolase [Myxococcota bacterium]|jgi:MazG family protein|nr:nucleoside triphosphate pyrophosphohydrolase [Myxococcota bacterium]HOE83330.1 nucleoside triphosphate pyrophosphohydrolase [Myxococcota bacterium]HON25760.1 nucleoside triphosphate pyrophosphohydrolase [Myxococcota bacterium]HOS62728.1 nucleoside triphosphate pyrophosphohydrolase [Myxococcota bacterium]HPC92684.1 nucleoside triphosphate pyrophosphohydrolase [Myxococcota bacterium]